MPRQRVTVYLVKHLGWAYNDECTVPHCATFEKAFRNREKAEFYRRELELNLRGNDPLDFEYEGPPRFETNWDDTRICAWLARFKLADPPLNPDSGRFDWTTEWLTRAEAQLGYDEFLRFCELFDRASYYYHVIETEMEI